MQCGLKLTEPKKEKKTQKKEIPTNPTKEIPTEILEKIPQEIQTTLYLSKIHKAYVLLNINERPIKKQKINHILN